MSFTSPLGFVLDDCRNIANALVEVKLVYVSRSMNQLAHSYARAADLSTLRGERDHFSQTFGRNVFDL